jgi:hypothetical protein
MASAWQMMSVESARFSSVPLPRPPFPPPLLSLSQSTSLSLLLSLAPSLHLSPALSRSLPISPSLFLSHPLYLVPSLTREGRVAGLVCVGM